MMNYTNIIRGIGGEPEIIRTLGAGGIVIYVFAAVGFTFWTVVVQAKPFDVVAFCTAFPAGFAVVIGAVAGASRIKDQGVAVATVTRETGNLPTANPAAPTETTIVNKPDDPVPTTTKDKAGK